MLLHVSVVMWLGDTIEFFVFLSSHYAWTDGKITEKIKIRPVASVLCGLQSEASDQ